MNSIAILILFVGIVFLIVGYNKSTNICPRPRIQYRFLPRSFYDEQLNPVKVSDVFSSMFSAPDSWLNRFNNLDDENIIQDYSQNYFSVDGHDAKGGGMNPIVANSLM